MSSSKRMEPGHEAPSSRALARSYARRGLGPILCFALVSLAVAISALAAPPAHAQEERAERVLAIGGAVTEIIYALGEEDRLIARDSTSSYPPEAMELPDVGYMRSLSPEGVLSVEPDLILARGNAGPVEAIEVLQAADVRWVTVPDDFTTEGVDENIRIVAEALGVPEKGDALRQSLAEDLAALRVVTEAIEERKTVLFVLGMREGRVNASGTGTAAHGIIELAGAENVISDYEGYRQISDEALILANPDVILMMGSRGTTSNHSAPNTQILEHPALGVTTAAQSGAIVRMNGLYLLGFGPRTGQAATELSQAIYGDQS